MASMTGFLACELQLGLFTPPVKKKGLAPTLLASGELQTLFCLCEEASVPVPQVPITLALRTL